MKRILVFLVVIVVAVIGLSFTVLNASLVHLDYYFSSGEFPLSLLIVIALAIGALFGVLASLSAVLRVKRELSKLKKDLKLKDQEIKNLRAIPMKDKH